MSTHLNPGTPRHLASVRRELGLAAAAIEEALSWDARAQLQPGDKGLPDGVAEILGQRLASLAHAITWVESAQAFALENAGDKCPA